MGNTCGLQSWDAAEPEHEDDEHTCAERWTGCVTGRGCGHEPHQPDPHSETGRPVAVAQVVVPAVPAITGAPSVDSLAPSSLSIGRQEPYIAPVLPHTVPLANGVESVEPEEVQRLLRQCNGRGCILVDVRDKDRATGVIDGSMYVPAVDMTASFYARLPELLRRFASQEIIIFTCQYSAHRAPTCANVYREKTHPRQRVAVMAGGFRAWEGKGLPVSRAQGFSNDAEARSSMDLYAVAQGQRFAHQPTMAQSARGSSIQHYGQHGPQQAVPLHMHQHRHD